MRAGGSVRLPGSIVSNMAWNILYISTCSMAWKSAHIVEMRRDIYI